LPTWNPRLPTSPKEGNGDTEDILGDFSSIVLIETSSKQVSPGELADKDALELRGLRFLLSLGDYAGRLCNCLRMAAADLGKPWPKSIVKLSDELRAAEARRKGEILDTLGECQYMPKEV
jgi:hypothetical protein